MLKPKKVAPMPVKKAAPMPVKKAAPSMTTPGPGGIGFPATNSNTGRTVLPGPATGTIGTTGVTPGAGASFDPKMFSNGMPNTSGGTSGQIAGIRPGASFGMKKGGKVNKMASGGTTKSASKRGDGIAQRGKTKGRMV